MSMWSLVQIPHSDLTATLEILHKLGVDQESFREIRSKPGFARKVAAVFRERQWLIDKATGSDVQKALIALEGVFDKETLVDVALRAQRREVSLWILSEKATSEVAIAVAKAAKSRGGRVIVEAALKKVPTSVLNEWDDRKDDWFSWFVEQELRRR